MGRAGMRLLAKPVNGLAVASHYKSSFFDGGGLPCSFLLRAQTRLRLKCYRPCPSTPSTPPPPPPILFPTHWCSTAVSGSQLGRLAAAMARSNSVSKKRM